MFPTPDRKVRIEVKLWARDFAGIMDGRGRKSNEVFKVRLSLDSVGRVCSDSKRKDLRNWNPGFVPIRVIAGEWDVPGNIISDEYACGSKNINQG